MPYLQPIFIIFLIISVGFAYARNRSISHEHIEGLDTFLFRIFMPCYFFMLMYHYDLATLIDLPYMGAFFATFAITALATLYIAPSASGQPMTSMHMFSCTFVNSAVFGLPVTIYVLQDPRAAVLGNFVQLILIQSLFVVYFSLARQRDVPWRQRLQQLIWNPMLAMPIAGLACNLVGLAPHGVILGALKALGDAAPAVALFNFGLSLGVTRYRDLVLTKPLVRLVFIKNILHPLVGGLVGAFVFHLEDYWLWALVLMTAAPPGFMTLRLAKTYHMNPPLIKTVMVTSGVVSMVLLLITAVVLSVLHINPVPIGLP